MEPVVEQFANGTYVPKAIIGTNIVGATFKSGLSTGNDGALA